MAHNILGNATSSLCLVFEGLLLSLIISIAVVLLAYNITIIAHAFSVVAMPLRYTPVTALAPLLISIVGIGRPLGLAVIVLGCAPFMSLQFWDIIKEEKTRYADFFSELGVNKTVSYVTGRLLGSIPRYIRVMRVTTSLAWSYVILAEILGIGYGLGYAIDDSRRWGRLDDAMVNIIIVGIIGFLLDVIYWFALKIWHRDAI